MKSFEEPIVTIGICARNCQNTIGQALYSVGRQDYPHEKMEIVIVDDGSEDGTLRVVQEYTKKTDIETTIFSDIWTGLGKSRNRILSNARGKYVIWVDSDEILTKDFVKNQVQLMERYPKAGIASGRLSILSKENPILLLELIPSVVDYSSQNWEKLTKMPGTGGSIYRIKAAKEVGGFDEDLKGAAEDIEIAGRMRKLGWSIIRGNSVFYERHGQMSTIFDLWSRFVRYGVNNRLLYLKNASFFSISRMNPLAGLITGVLYTPKGFKLTNRMIIFFLPLHFAFKMTAWFYGFSKR